MQNSSRTVTLYPVVRAVLPGEDPTELQQVMMKVELEEGAMVVLLAWPEISIVRLPIEALSWYASTRLHAVIYRETCQSFSYRMSRRLEVDEVSVRRWLSVGVHNDNDNSWRWL